VANDVMLTFWSFHAVAQSIEKLPVKEKPIATRSSLRGVNKVPATPKEEKPAGVWATKPTVPTAPSLHREDVTLEEMHLYHQ
jgi:hypothetical protein